MSYPTGIDSFTNPTASNNLNSPSHSTQHINTNAALTALETKVGVDGSAVTSTIDYKITPREIVDADGATVTFDLSTRGVHKVVLGGNRTLAISNPTVGQFFAIELVQDNSGSRTVTWFSTINWVGNTSPTLTTTLNKKDTFMFRVTGAGTYDGYIVGMNI